MTGHRDVGSIRNSIPGGPMPGFLSVATAVPDLCLTQEEVYRHLRYEDEKVLKIFRNSEIDRRHFFIDPERFDPDEDPDAQEARFREGARLLGGRAAARALEAEDISRGDVGFLGVATCTGYICPGLSAYLAGDLELDPGVQRTDLLGHGCGGAMPLIQRAHDYVKANPDRLALGVATEICSAAVFVDDSYDTKIGNAICADGAAAFVMGAGATGPGIVRLRSHLDIPHREDVGFERKRGKLRIVLRKSIRDVAGPTVERVVKGLLDEEGIPRDRVRHWILHPGGRKVIDGVRRALGLDEEAVRHTKAVYRRYGNMSSPTVLFVLEECLGDGSPPAPGDLGILLAMGPGLAVEAALLRW